MNGYNPRIDVLNLIGPMLIERPDCSYVFAQYLKKFPESQEASDILLDTLKRDPTYDAAAAHYIDAMDICEPARDRTQYRRVIHTANKRSEENSILLRLAILAFRARRAVPKDAVRLIQEEPDSRVRNLVLHRLFGNDSSTPYKVADCLELLEDGITSEDEDFARYCALQLIYQSLKNREHWEPPSNVNKSVLTLMVGLRLRKKGPTRVSVLETFFKQMGVSVKIPWPKALGSDLADAESRCLRLQEFRNGDPTASVFILDTFNEVLMQAFAQKHPLLNVAYAKAAGKNAHPDYGNWLNNGAVAPVLTNSIKWFLSVHSSRVKGDLAHAKSKKGTRTRPISYKLATSLWRQGKANWEEFLTEWKKHL